TADQAAARATGAQAAAAPPAVGDDLAGLREAAHGLAVVTLADGVDAGDGRAEGAITALRRRRGFVVVAAGEPGWPDALAALSPDTLVLVTRGAGPRLPEGGAGTQP